MRSRFSAILVSALAAGGSANAASLTGSSPGFHYFYKQGATMEAHDAALVDCAVRLRAMVNGSNTFIPAPATGGGFASGFAAGALAGLIGGVIDNNENRQGDAANTEGCMAIKGWSVVALSREEGLAMEEPGEAAAIHEKLQPLVEADAPPGAIMRGPFANELAVGDFKVGRARDLEEVSMSVRATRDQSKAAIEAVGDLKPAKPDLPEDVKKPKTGKALRSAEFAAAETERAYLVVRLVGRKSTMAKAVSLAFKRLANDGSEIVYDGSTTILEAGSRSTNKGEIGGVKYFDYVFEVPQGRWKFAEIAQFQYGVTLCFGAPAIEIEDGDVLYLGAMDVGGDGGYPIETDMAVAREILAANPALAEKVTPAEWTNGFTADCFGSYAYAYEMPGAPFIDMPSLARAAASAGTVESPSDTNPSEAELQE